MCRGADCGSPRVLQSRPLRDVAGPAPRVQHSRGLTGRRVDSSTFAHRAATYLRGAMGAPDLEVSNAQKIVGGASRHTWSVDARWDGGGESPQVHGLIFRLDPPSSLLESNRGTEYSVY